MTPRRPPLLSIIVGVAWRFAAISVGVLVALALAVYAGHVILILVLIVTPLGAAFMWYMRDHGVEFDDPEDDA